MKFDDEPVPVGSVWESYNGREVYLVVARDDQTGHARILVLESELG